MYIFFLSMMKGLRVMYVREYTFIFLSIQYINVSSAFKLVICLWDFLEEELYGTIKLWFFIKPSTISLLASVKLLKYLVKEKMQWKFSHICYSSNSRWTFKQKKIYHSKRKGQQNWKFVNFWWRNRKGMRQNMIASNPIGKPKKK